MNTSDFRAENIVFGVGGRQPGVQIYNAISDSLETILSLDEGYSVYAIDVSPDGKTIVAGTKTGAIHWLTWQGPEQGDAGFLVEQVSHGRPVVSISFVEASTIAVADTTGRCFLRQVGKDAQPKELSSGKRIIYKLFHLGSRHLAGLGINGDLLVWDWLRDDLIQVMEAPVPPKEFLALTRPVYWPAAAVWVWPGRGGLIVFYNQRSNEMNCVWSGAREVYAMVICNEQLLTIGTDGHARHWHLGTGKPADSFKAPRGIISATSWQQDDSPMLLLINDEGKAGVYLLTDMGLELIKPLPGQDYRTAVGPDAEKLRLAVQQQKMIRVKELTAQINEKIVRQQYSELEDYYNNLDELGYRQVALALRGREARSKNDFVAELRISSELVDIIPHDHPGSKNSLVRHAELLESAWQLPEALGLYRELADRYLDSKSYPETVQRLSEYINEIKTGRCVIEPDIAVLSLIESAMVLAKRFRGRYLLEARQPVSCRVVLGAGEFVKKYEQLCDGKPQMPTAQEMELRWLSGHKVELITTVVFRNQNLDGFNDIELGVKFFSSRLQTVLVPVMMLNTGKKTNRMSIEQSNRGLIKELRHIEDDHFKGWLEMVEHTINHTVRRLITQKQAETIRQSGGIRC
ncbi:MAG: WD40 repeat domain-containing protein [Desulfobacteraceae bacterium]|nr:WD40 repeat domain-containing protein [Desulfobacteraceae bacterium]